MVARSGVLFSIVTIKLKDNKKANMKLEIIKILMKGTLKRNVSYDNQLDFSKFYLSLFNDSSMDTKNKTNIAHSFKTPNLVIF